MQNLIKLINIDPLQDGQGRKMLEEDRSLKREEETTSWSTTTTTAITTTGMCIRWNDGASGRDLLLVRLASFHFHSRHPNYF